MLSGWGLARVIFKKLETIVLFTSKICTEDLVMGTLKVNFFREFGKRLIQFSSVKPQAQKMFSEVSIELVTN